MLTIQTLIDDLAAGCKPKDQFRMGLELERFAYRRDTGVPLFYDGKAGIRALLEQFAQEDGWNKICEDGHVIALEKRGTALTLEPGGQVEYSGPPLKTLAELSAQLQGFHEALAKTADKLGIGFMSCGFHPYWRREDIHFMPKARYRLMRAYMPQKGELGLDMMLRTCGTQINLDYKSEQDMVRKFRVILGIQPVVTALMSNSRMKDGADSGYESYRAHIWTDTDPDRCGFPAFVFDENMGFARYVEKALDVPMYFFRRDGAYIDVSGQSFRDFMAGRLKGHEGVLPDINDWHDHLSTIFWDVRLKRYLELRGPDSAPPEQVMAMAAFWAGILYNGAALEKAADFVAAVPLSVHLDIHRLLPRDGLLTATGKRQTLADWAGPLLEIAAEGLSAEEHDWLRPFYERPEHKSVRLKSPTVSGC